MEDGNERMLTHLGRTRLGQTEKTDASSQAPVVIRVQSFFHPEDST
jgi:hypothetical protein